MNEEKKELESMFLTAEKMYSAIDELVKSTGCTYIEATIKVCEDKKIDYYDIKKLKLLSPLLYSKIRMEAIESGQVKSEAMLDL